MCRIVAIRIVHLGLVTSSVLQSFNNCSVVCDVVTLGGLYCHNRVDSRVWLARVDRIGVSDGDENCGWIGFLDRN